MLVTPSTRESVVLPERADTPFVPYLLWGKSSEGLTRLMLQQGDVFRSPDRDLIFAGAIVADERIRANEEGSTSLWLPWWS